MSIFVFFVNTGVMFLRSFFPASILKYINLGNHFHHKKYNQKLHNVEYYENTSFVNISISFLRSLS